MRSWMIICLARCAPLFSISRVPAGAEAAKPVKICNSNDDCKLFPCTSSFGLCVNHLCTCQVADININDYHAPCRSSTDCRDTAEDCPWGKAVLINDIGGHEDNGVVV
ncbi:hypothetical protein GBA52_002720 [Prunus armeniaca]|nr:hypothetical protein GBA52_002720 [Prunus armeniaca]